MEVVLGLNVLAMKNRFVPVHAFFGLFINSRRSE